MKHISVIGSCNMDVTVEADRRPRAGETIIGNRLVVSPGGKGANQAVAASRLGGKVYMIGCVGQDAYGKMMLEAMGKSGVNTDYVEVLPDTATGSAHITLAEGDNSIIVIRGANAKVGKALIDRAWPVISTSAMVVLQHEIPLSVNAYIIERCFKEHIPVILNPAPYMPVPEDLITKISFITPNEHEAAQLFPDMDRDSILKSHEGQVIMTAGREGVLYSSHGDTVHVPSFHVPVVDTTGAGDTFNGAFACAMVEGKELKDAIRFANAASALSIGKVGAQSGMPWRKELEEFLSCRK